ncbi:hypothetical protein [uncultured Acetobacteroides sp.]|uniref:hypothetical protein n=1 Tax=uncultured Acetobacteroides sp. TaxID=1760811 RepID=UPI0029F56AC2|nr:hypothetical protein [uncultured Acetobacteroides sp.]
MRMFLHIKHWQVFTLTFVVPALLFLVEISLASHSYSHYSNSLQAVNENLGVKLLTLLLHTACYAMVTVWYWVVGCNLHAISPKKTRPSISRFKLCIMLSLAVAIAADAAPLLGLHNVKGYAAFITLVTGIYAYIYCTLFIQKLVRAIESNDTPEEDDKAIFFILWLIFPLGIWFIQPRINSIFKRQKCA